MRRSNFVLVFLSFVGCILPAQVQAFASNQPKSRSLSLLHFAVKSQEGPSGTSSDGSDDEDDFSLSAFQKRKKEREEKQQTPTREFDGYGLRDVIYEKWGSCYDVDFNRVDSFGFRKLYLNVLPFHLGGRRFRHKTELDYLCHLQAVVEILEKYGQLDYILAQIEETDKKPRAGTSPLVAVPLRLDLTKEQVQDILGY
jgi:hypothetical protein